MTDEYSDKRYLPNPADVDTKMYWCFERLRDRLPPLVNAGGKVLKVKTDESGCYWTTSGVESVSWGDITGDISESVALMEELNKKVNKDPNSAKSVTVGADEDGMLYCLIE